MDSEMQRECDSCGYDVAEDICAMGARNKIADFWYEAKHHWCCVYCTKHFILAKQVLPRLVWWHDVTAPERHLMS
jgi:hypothetical protein